MDAAATAIRNLNSEIPNPQIPNPFVPWNCEPYRAATMHEALAMVRRELGPDAAVLHTREVAQPLAGLLPGPRQIEVTASRGVNVPSRLPLRGLPQRQPAARRRRSRRPPCHAVPPPKKRDSRTRCRANSAPCRRWSRTVPAFEGRRPRRLARGAVPPVHRSARRRTERRVARELVERVRSDPRARAFPTRCC